MAKIGVVCPCCTATHAVIRHGHSGSGAPRYRCQRCLKTFPLSYHYNGARADAHQTLVDMAVNVPACRDSARVPGISLSTVLHHRKTSRHRRSRKMLNPEQKSSSVAERMNTGHMCVAKAIHDGGFMLMLASAKVFSPTHVARII